MRIQRIMKILVMLPLVPKSRTEEPKIWMNSKKRFRRGTKSSRTRAGNRSTPTKLTQTRARLKGQKLLLPRTKPLMPTLRI